MKDHTPPQAELAMRTNRKFTKSAREVFTALKSGTLFASCGKEITKLDFQVGGHYDLKYKQNDRISGEFLQIDPNKSMLFTWSQGGQVEIKLETQTNGCMMTLNHGQIPNQALVDRFTAGWADGLDTFQSKVEAL
jgi:uncharacterized protein YndB with AHSA1/START domain